MAVSKVKSSKKCTCFHNQKSQQQKSTSIPPSEQPSGSSSLPSPSINESTPRANVVNRHSSLMQTAALSAYHTSEPQRSPIKSCSLLNNAENGLDMQNDAYEFVDNAKKASYLIGSARCTLVTASAAVAANNTNANTNNTASTSSRARFGKSASRSVIY